MSIVDNPRKLYTRVIRAEITLNQTQFIQQGESMGNTLVINAPAPKGAVNPVYQTINATINETLGQQMDNSADITIFGLSTNLISQISTIGQIVKAQFNYNLNTIRLYAGYDDNVPLVYTGQIIKAYADYNDVNRPLHLQCTTNMLMQLDNPSATNPEGQVSLDTMFANLAKLSGWGYTNNGVTGQISNPILTGSFVDQLKQLAGMTRTSLLVKNNVLSVAPLNTAHSDQILLLSKDSGLIGYPTIDQLGIMFKMYFNPIFKVGQYVQIQSYVPKASGQWYAYSTNTQISNNMEQWFTYVRLAPDMKSVGDVSNG